MNVPMLAHALDYVARGVAVLPLVERPRNGKAPYVRGGYKAASIDVAQVRRWWGRYPGALIGIRPPVGVVVIDVDPRNGGTMTALEHLNGAPLPPTATVRTGGGGWHLYYRCTPGSALRPHLVTPQGQPVAGVDVITGARGYVVAPPSIHPVTGRAYEWESGAPLAELPPGLCEAATCPATPPPVHSAARSRSQPHSRYTPRQQEKGARRLIEHFRRSTREGHRNIDLFNLACRLGEENHPPAIFDELAAAALSVGLSFQEVQTTLNSARLRTRGAA